MYKIQLTTTRGNPVTIYFNSNLTVSSYYNNDCTKEVCVMGGNHNNGGWKGKKNYEQVNATIEAAILK